MRLLQERRRIDQIIEACRWRGRAERVVPLSMRDSVPRIDVEVTAPSGDGVSWSRRSSNELGRVLSTPLGGKQGDDKRRTPSGRGRLSPFMALESGVDENCARPCRSMTLCAGMREWVAVSKPESQTSRVEALPAGFESTRSRSAVHE